MRPALARSLARSQKRQGQARRQAGRQAVCPESASEAGIPLRASGVGLGWMHAFKVPSFPWLIPHRILSIIKATWYSPCRPTRPSQEWGTTHSNSRRRRRPRSVRRRMRRIPCIVRDRPRIRRYRLRHSRYSSSSSSSSSSGSSSYHLSRRGCRCSLSRRER